MICKTCDATFPSIVEVCEHRLRSLECLAQLDPEFMPQYTKKPIPNITARSKRIAVRFTNEELAWLERWGGIGPTVHQLIDTAMRRVGDLGPRIRSYCERNNLTLKDFAKVAGLDFDTVADVANLRTLPSAATRKRIEEFIGSDRLTES